jgi:hypothetical protein
MAYRTCDRCSKVFGEAVGVEAVADLQAAPKDSLTVMRNGEIFASFDDLCPICRKALDNLLNRVILKKDEDDPVEETAPQTDEAYMQEKAATAVKQADLMASAAATYAETRAQEAPVEPVEPVASAEDFDFTEDAPADPENEAAYKNATADDGPLY